MATTTVSDGQSQTPQDFGKRARRSPASDWGFWCGFAALAVLYAVLYFWVSLNLATGVCMLFGALYALIYSFFAGKGKRKGELVEDEASR